MQGLLDFDVAIEPFADGYRARVVASPAGEAHADFALPFTDTDVENFVLKIGMSIGRGRRQARRIQSDERRLLEEFGDRLFQAAFCGPVRDCLTLSRAVAESRGSGLRIRLRLPGTLANVPWEYLYDAQYGFIGLSPETVLVRYVEMPAPVSPFAVSPPLRVLAMISAPDDLPELQGEQEWGKLTGALADLADRGMVQVDRLEAGTLVALQRPLRLREYHVLHFVGHGVYDDAAQDGALALEGTDGKTRLVTGRDLGLMIRGHRSLRLVVLNACEGARSARDDPLGGVAQALVRQGIPAVIAMQFEISDPAALVFSKSFYQAIADGLPVDAAMVEARVAMFAEGHEVEWATPVLYLRSPDGRVFTVGPIPEVERQARDDAERQARDDAERQARDDAERQARDDAERQARDDAERQARDDAERQARDDAERRDRELATHYAVACAAADTQDWDQALTWFTRITDVDPGYRDAQERAEDARKQQQITRWQAEARRLHRNAQWAGVVKAGLRLHALDPTAADPDGLVTSARAKLAAAERAKQVDVDYETALHLLDAGDWQQAIQALERVAQVNPAYRATPALLARARRQHAASAKQPAQPRPAEDSRSRATPSRAGPVSGSWTLAATLSIDSYGYSVAFGPPSEGMLASGAMSGQITLWDHTDGRKLRTIEFEHADLFQAVFSDTFDLTRFDGAIIASMAFSPDGWVLASRGKDHTVQLWNPATGQQLRALTGHTGPVRSVAFSPDGQVLASAGYDNTARLWNPATGQQLRALTGQIIAFSLDGQFLASADNDFTIRLWNPATGQQLRTLRGHTNRIHSLAFGSGPVLASAGADATIRLWNPATGRRLPTLTGHDGNVLSVAFSPDGRILASSGYDSTVRLWDLATSQQTRVLTGHTDQVESVAFSPDGQVLASTGHDSTVRLWR